MVIVRLSPGLANQMLEYAAAYALSRELNQELILDVSESLNGCKGFMLDEYTIPLFKKVVYNQQDAEAVGHEDLKGIPAKIRADSKVLIQNRCEKGTIDYQNLDMAELLKEFEKIYLCGYFFERGKYYKKYWDEIRQMFKLRHKNRNVEVFQELIRDKVSVGIHVRRGDFIVSGWAEKLEDDYFRAAVECFRKKYETPVFCVFSDDIAYAKKILGKDSSIYYVHFLGYDDAALEEFLCLSKCNHRILSNSSTFSSLADLLNWGSKRHCFLKDVQNKPLSSLEVENFIKDGEYQREIHLNKADIEKYSETYRSDHQENIIAYGEEMKAVMEAEITEKNAENVLETLGRLSLNVYDSKPELVTELLYKKFEAQVAVKEYAGALQAAFCLYTTYVNERKYKRLYTKVLCECGFYEEALIEAISLGSTAWDEIREKYGLKNDKWKTCYDLFAGFPKSHFLIVPYTKSYASSKIYGLIALGLVLFHAGHKVSFIYEPADEGEKYYISKNPILKNRQEACLGCNQYLLEDVKKQGYAKFMKQFSTDDLIVLSRKKEFFVDKEELSGQKVMYVYPAFAGKEDPEMAAAQRNHFEENEISDMADIVFKPEEKHAKEKDYCIIEERWSMVLQNRLPEKAIHETVDLMKALINRV